MNTDQPDTDPRNDLVHALVHATMPDGTPISSRVKAETILAQLGITDCPTLLVRLVAAGVGHRMRCEKRWLSPEEHKARTLSEPEAQPVPLLRTAEPVQEPVPVVEAMPQLYAITPPRIVQRPIVTSSRRELSPSKGPRLSRRDQERRDGPELIKHSRRTGGFPLKETVRITIRKPRQAKGW